MRTTRSNRWHLRRAAASLLTGREQPERVDGMYAQSSLFQMLGAKPLLGRLLLPEEDKPGKPPVAILSDRLWKRLFHSDPEIVGKSISAQRQSVHGGRRAAARIPAERRSDAVGRADGQGGRLSAVAVGCRCGENRGDENFNILVRLKPGVSVQQAQADIDMIASRIREKDKRDASFGMHVVGLQDQVVGDVRRALLVLLGSVALVLLIACANVANLLLTRAAGREKEVAIRTALGAGWQRIVRQLLTESFCWAILGGAAGLLVAQLSLYVVRTMNPGNIPRLEDIDINGVVLAFTFGVSLGDRHSVRPGAGVARH